MNYQKIYDDICKRGQTRILPKEIYTEKHHIVPKCLGGGNEKSNITVLTAREHFLVHWILARNLFPNNRKLWCALKFMTHDLKGKKRVSSARIFEEIKYENWRLGCGKNSPRYGKGHTNAAKEKIKLARSKQIITNEHRDKISKTLTGKITGTNHAFYGKHHTDEAKKLISSASKGRIVSKETRKKLSEIMRPKGYRARNAIKIIHMETGMQFESYKDAATYFGVCSATIMNRIKSGIFERV